MQLVETQKTKRAAEDFELADSIEYPEEQMIEGHEISKRAADAVEYSTMQLVETQKTKRAAEDFELAHSIEYPEEQMIEDHEISKRAADAEEYPSGNEAQKSEEYEMKSKRAAEDFDLSDSIEYQDKHMIEAHQKQSAEAEEYPEGE